MDTMGIMSAALGWDCSECHTGAGTDTVKWEADTEKKRTARRMTLMVAAINRTNFANRQVVTCWTCHRGRDIPVTMPTIDTVYGEPLLEADEIVRPSAQGAPSADQILDKYLEALGGVERLSKVTSFVATGTSEGFRGFGGGGTVQIFAKAPDRSSCASKGRLRLEPFASIAIPFRRTQQWRWIRKAKRSCRCRPEASRMSIKSAPTSPAAPSR